MKGIDSISLKGFRCFKEGQGASIRPITVLLGENGAGKTSFLGSCQALGQVLSGREIDFNEPPLQMGAFSDLANGRGGRFDIGYGFRKARKDCKVTLSISEARSSGCRVSSVALELAGSARMEIRFTEEGRVSVSSPTGRPVKLTRIRNHNGPVDLAAKLVFSMLVVSMQERTGDEGLSERLVETEAGLSLAEARRMHGSLSAAGVPEVIEQLFGSIKQRTIFRCDSFRKVMEGIERDFCFRPARSAGQVCAFAPVRSEPKRVCGTVAGRNAHEGDHVPSFLRRLKAEDPKEWKGLRDSLREFGTASGLFTDISVRDFEGLNGPFELRAKAGNSWRNVADAGYGVSQALPLLVEMFLRRDEACTYLLQQPEVHLHPRAQAELASTLARASNITDSAFIVETHSDHFVDRLRIEVLSGKLSPEDVSLLFFSPVARGGVKVHNLTLGRRGNVIGAPPHYREFFLAEVNRMLGAV